MHIKVHLTPGAKTTHLEQIAPHEFRAAVRAKAQGGAANKALQKLLISHFGPGVILRLVGGHRGPHKLYEVTSHSYE